MLGKIKEFFALERNVVVLALTNIIWGSGAWLFIEFVPKYYEALGATVVLVGILFTIHQGLRAFFHGLGGYMSDLYGRKRVYIISSLVGIIAMMIYFFAPSWIFLLPGIVLISLTEGVSSTADSIIITESLSKKKRATGRATVLLITTIAASLIFPIGGLLVQKFGILNGVRLSLIVASITVAIAMVFANIFLKETLRRKPKNLKMKIEIKPLIEFFKKISPQIKYFIVSISISTFAWSMMNLYFIFYAFDIIGIQPIEWGILMSIELLSLGFFTFAGAKISDKYGRRNVILISLLMFALIPLIYINSHNFFQLSLLYILMGSVGLGWASVEAYLADHTSQKLRGKTIGISDSLLTASAIPGPVFGGILFSISPQTPFIASAIIGLTSVLIAWKFLK